MLYAATDNPTCCNEDGRSRMLQLRPGIDKKKKKKEIKKKKRRVGSAGWGWGSSPKWQHHNYYTDPSLWIWNQRLRLECNCGQVNCLWTSCWNFLNDNFLIWKWKREQGNSPESHPDGESGGEGSSGLRTEEQRHVNHLWSRQES